MSKKVFVNRTLNLKRIRFIGFDMDHTLVRYNSNNFEAVAHQIMLEKLVSEKNYPKSILKLKFDFDRAIRGLVIDKVRGNVIKLSRHAAIRVSYHGLKPLDYATQKKLYKSTYIDLSDPDYDTVDTTFSIAFAGLFMQLVELKDTTEATTLPDYYGLADDLNYVLDKGHRDGSIKDQVRKDLDKFIIKDPVLVHDLERYKKHGKRLFIATNSDYSYSKLLLDYAINPFLKEHKHWSELFEFVITLAQKPKFFVDKSRFLRVDPKTEMMQNQEGKLEPGIYQGGSAYVFTADLAAAPDEILYIGDHIYGDIVRLKKDCAWRTALVVEELADELAKEKKNAPAAAQINELMSKKIPLETQVDDLISIQIEEGHKKNEKKIHELMDEISEIDKKISSLIKKQQAIYNPLWGEVSRAGIEESYFAYQVDRFACVYMSKLSDLLDMSPRTYFRSVRRPLAHDFE